jgi:hypothetical protein
MGVIRREAYQMAPIRSRVAEGRAEKMPLFQRVCGPYRERYDTLLAIV